MVRKFGDENFNYSGFISLDLMFNPPDYPKRSKKHSQYYPKAIKKKLEEQQQCEKEE